MDMECCGAGAKASEQLVKDSKLLAQTLTNIISVVDDSCVSDIVKAAIARCLNIGKTI